MKKVIKGLMSFLIRGKCFTRSKLLIQQIKFKNTEKAFGSRIIKKKNK